MASFLDSLIPANSLRLGSSGEEVKKLQIALNQQLGTSLTVDGNFGPGVASAVIAFQIKNGLGPDSVVGPKTKKALGL
ncbi:peptidoglycan-binding domain-containing protein [Planktothrix agardhii]|uniref:peptidoglycan-binding domain-containing protein n=1 Tax=Planktothrix agardhii TaxID=1160 RepID=UPI00047FD679|nr:peptidoglycan-binding domain-containing protein [Planktothrix agardhii]CAD5938387.1 Zinc D-Ala-D-Ala carboxypeptidase [Planktothrix agardhii]